MSYPADLGTTEGRIVVPNTGYSDDGDAYTLGGVTRPPPGTPTITSLNPNTAVHTDAPLRVTITGTDFARADRVMFGGATPPTQFRTDTELAVDVDPRQWQPGTLTVLVAVSSRGPSNAVDFTVT